MTRVQVRPAPKLRLSDVELDRKAQALFNLLEAHARNNLRCPTVFNMVAGLGIGPNRVLQLLERLRDDRRIAWRMEWSRETGPLRVVTILATKQSTRGPAPIVAARGKPSQPDLLEAAKNALRRTGAHVWDCAVDGIGPRGCVRVDREFLRPVEVIARAAALSRQN